MQSRIQDVLLAMILLLTGAGGALGLLMLNRPADTKPPVVLIVRPGHAPVQWRGWQLTPPPSDVSGDCVQSGYDRCSDGQGPDGEAVDDAQDNEPIAM